MDNHARDGVEGRGFREAGDLHKLEAVEGKAGLPGFARRVALEDVDIGGEGLAEVFRHETAILMEHFAVAELDLSARLAFYLELDDTGEILAHVDDEDTGVDFLDGLGRDAFSDADGYAGVSLIHGRFLEAEFDGLVAPLIPIRGLDGAVVFGEDGAFPGLVVEVGRAPARLFEAGVIGFAHLHVGDALRSFACLPGGVGDDGLGAAIAVFDFQLGLEGRGLAIEGAA